jgi:hypothetical protein
VKSEPKAFASLSSGLLARKGAARPAMRPQGFGQAGAGLEDLGWNDMGFEPPKPALAPVRDADHDAFGEELEDAPRASFAGLTPVNAPVHVPVQSPVPSPVHSQQAEIVGRLAPSYGEEPSEEEFDETAELYEPEAETAPEPAPTAAPAPVSAPAPEPVVAAAPAPQPRRAAKPRPAAGAKNKAAFTLRLNPERHLKLRLACAITGRSAQLLVTDALDALLASMPELDAMAAKANRKG